MKILGLDLETAPHKVYSWGLWGQDIHINQIVEPGYTLCWAAKWVGKPTIYFESRQHKCTAEMLRPLHDLLDEADAVIHFNGSKFDVPVVNKEFLLAGMDMPSPYKQIDLLQTARRQFKFPSNKLDYISQALGLGAKTKHAGMDLWKGCMDGDPKSWRIMERYNKQDVKLLEKVYHKLLPWIDNHPNHGVYTDSNKMCCTNCGSGYLSSRGYEYTKTGKYQRLKCNKCGHWNRHYFNEIGKEKRQNVLR